MKRVLLITNSSEDAYCLRRETIEELLACGYAVTIALPYGKNVETFTAMGCSYAELPIARHGKNPPGEIRLFFRCHAAIKKAKPDAVLTYTVKPNIHGGLVCRLLRIPHIANVTGLGVMAQKGPIRVMLFMLQRIALKKSACVFFQNKANFALYREKRIVAAQGRLIPGSGVNLAKFTPAPYPPDGGAVKFLTVAKLRGEKGFDELFAAIRELKDAGAEFYVAGPSEGAGYLAKLEALRADCPVTYLGHLSHEEVREQIAGCHCLVHPSRYGEGMANIILESAASARPVITTDIPGCREAVEDGVSAYVFPKGDAGALAERVRQFMSLTWEEKRAMGLAGRQKMEGEFDRRVVAEAYVRAVGEV